MSKMSLSDVNMYCFGFVFWLLTPVVPMQVRDSVPMITDVDSSQIDNGDFVNSGNTMNQKTSKD